MGFSPHAILLFKNCLFPRSQIENLRSCTITSILPLIKTPVWWFCWIAVSCEPLTLGTHTDRILNYQLPHSPTHDLNVLGGEKGLLGVECKEGAVTFSAIRPFTNHHWPLEGAQPNMESREWVPLPCQLLLQSRAHSQPLRLSQLTE